MAKDDKDATAADEAPKKSKKMLIMIVAIALVVLGGGGAGAFFMLRGDTAEAKEEPVKGIVTAIENTLTVNLAEGHYLKLGFAIQQTEEGGEEAVDINEALNIAIETYTGRDVAELSTDEGRNAIKAEFLEKLKKAYTKDGVEMVMDVYFTSFVTQ
ncbi:flagellar basal body-associated protein FliL [Actinoplanes sp. DH11]|uniref:flagellar basal body-associated FliL family protein n=1 Tax=Actinoplanes sp. DH11 TaxID=2857011 RepID=UPI001E42DBFF|nr:flagellar basal body-associated FliL family protein [Actinoplanes sp. DH11]